ncbi:extracellular solute-binding protein [Bradyrhizobium vignae]|uniref:extracellular solute-binding protein n=1 Tax=Bradyrhizobium vignae TaxID=1549949 RepID=UPI0024BF69B2|nr:extracellular solute-binding protein [Bradyrhizobium vignae]
MLNTSEGVDRALRKLDTIKKDVVWWQSTSQPAQLLADGQVVMTSIHNGRIYDAVKNIGKPFEGVWDTQIQETAVWIILISLTLPCPSRRRDLRNTFLTGPSTKTPSLG